MNVSKQNAGRLVMTEQAAFSNAAQKDCFAELGVEQFEILETLDSFTCSLCGSMDGQHFPMSQYEIGVTAPPFHPNCVGVPAHTLKMILECRENVQRVVKMEKHIMYRAI